MTAARRRYDLELPQRPPLGLGERPLIMGILNVTPDSFAGDGLYANPEAAAAAALAMQADGADLIDIGGESTRPGAGAVSPRDELDRLVPVLRAVRRRGLSIPVSVDTSKADVARAALAEGAAIVNDVTGLRADPSLADVVAREKAALVLMHMRGRPETMYGEARYDDLIGEIAAELRGSVDRALDAGVPRSRLIVDPGIGFAKRAPHSYGVLARLPELAQALDLPVLVGPSRKSFMSGALDGRPPVERDWGTAAAVTAAVLAGAHIVRVHAVGPMAQVARVAEEIRRHARRDGGRGRDGGREGRREGGREDDALD